MPTMRARSFLFDGRRFTMRFPRTLPVFAIAQVETMLRTIFCALPALRRVDPATTSAPVSTTIGRSAARSIGVAGLELRLAVRAPRSRAASSAPTT